MKAALGAIAAGADPAAKAAQYKALAGDCEQSTADSAVVGLLKEMVTHSSCGIFLRNFFANQKPKSHSSTNSRKTNLKVAFLLVYNSWILLDSTRVQAEIHALLLRCTPTHPRKTA